MGQSGFLGREHGKPHQPGSRMDRRSRLCLPALFRLLGIFRHGDRHRPPLRHSPSAEFQLALQIRKHHGFLAPLAHDAFPLPARLHLYRPRRQPLWVIPPLAQSLSHHAYWRFLARSGMDISPLGRAAWIVSHDQPHLDCAARAHPHSRRYAFYRLGWATTDFSRRACGMDFFPCLAAR